MYDEKITVIRQDPIAIGAQVVLHRYARPEEQVRAASHLQRQAGTGIVEMIMNVGGRAIVDLGLRTPPPIDDLDPGQRYILDGLISPADIYTKKITTYTDHFIRREEVTHWEYFPADWVCLYCGCIVDGLKSPRKCPQCAGPRTPPPR